MCWCYDPDHGLWMNMHRFIFRITKFCTSCQFVRICLYAYLYMRSSNLLTIVKNSVFIRVETLVKWVSTMTGWLISERIDRIKKYYLSLLRIQPKWIIVKGFITSNSQPTHMCKQSHDQYIVVNVVHISMVVELWIMLVDRHFCILEFMRMPKYFVLSNKMSKLL